MSYQGETEFKGIGGGKIPAYTAYEPCPICRGSGASTYQGIKRPFSCLACRGKGRLPMSSADGRFIKK